MTETIDFVAPPPEAVAVRARGIVMLVSPFPFGETVKRLRSGLLQKGIRIFAEIDQKAAAYDLGMSLRPTTLLLFGNPLTGTPVMEADPDAGLDLPLKLLVTERGPGEVRVSMNTAAWIAGRHGLPADLEAKLAPAETLVRNLLRDK
jgi:uncharacterized protein (DUF302 family)